MKFALFLGCNIPARVEQYESASREVLSELGVELIDTDRFNCCGYPIRNFDFKAFLLASVRNLALAEELGLNVMTLCACCFGTLKKAHHLLSADPALRQELNQHLAKEGLRYEGVVEVTHLLPVLHKQIGLEAIKQKVSRSYGGLKIAVHYGCHALRPSGIVQFDNPVAPTLFDELVELTGAESIYWPTKLECCGAPVLGINDDLSMKLTEKKLADGKKSGADYLCVACPYCHMQFDTIQKRILSERGSDGYLPSILYPQLLGLSLGIDPDKLGLGMNQIDLKGITGFFRSEEEATEGLTSP